MKFDSYYKVVEVDVVKYKVPYSSPSILEMIFTSCFDSLVGSMFDVGINVFKGLVIPFSICKKH